MSYKLLNTIRTSADLRGLDADGLSELAEDIRQLIKATVSSNGGHLASNLGMVELTIAMHYVFDFEVDRLVLDVGHQCYVHKILTGRAGQFSTLRQAGGLSGFPDPCESKSDQFKVGHAGTAVATAVGLALGAQMQGSDEKVIAVVGDASIVNGLSFEGLNNTSLVQRQMLIILNDNSMAIDKTEGAFAKYLTQARLSSSYGDLQRRTKIMVRRMPFVGDAIGDALHRIKGGIKKTLQVGREFEQLRIPTFGPVDGHDIDALIHLLMTFKEVNHPVLLHVQTEKGRGFKPASVDPCKFHSPEPFKVDGESAYFTPKGGRSFTSAFAEALAGVMRDDDRVVALTAAMPGGTGLSQLRNEFADRVIDVGIAESAAVDIAAGLAKTGRRPVVAIYSTFMQRAFDQVFQEISLQNLPVTICMDRAGLVGGDGAVHHGFCDISLLRTLPHMVLMSPMDGAELEESLRFAVGSDKPSVVRYPRDTVAGPEELPEGYVCEPMSLGKAVCLRSGKDAVIVGYGSVVIEALKAAAELGDEGYDVGVVSARFAKPLDEQLFCELLGEAGPGLVLTVEDHSLIGGFGAGVLELAHERQWDTTRIKRLGMPDRFVGVNSRAGQLKEVGIDASGIVKRLRAELVESKVAF